MSAQTIVEVIVKSSAKVIAAIKAMADAKTTYESKKVVLSKSIRSEGERLGYDEEQTRQMTLLSWREAAGFKSTDEAEVKAFDLKNRPDVSKILRLAFPVETHKEELQKANTHNDSKNGSKHGRIAEGKLLEIARGNMTFQEALEGNTPKAKVTAPTVPTKPLTAENFGNEFSALVKRFKAVMTLDQMADATTALLAEYAEEPTEEPAEEVKTA